MMTNPTTEQARTSQHQLTAQLVYDTRSQPLPRGVRGVVQRARRMLFAADDYELLLQVSRGGSPDRFKIMGQFWSAGAPLAGAAVRLEGPSSISNWATDGAGQFRLTEMPWGSYSIEVGTGDHLVKLPALGLDGMA